MRFVLWVFGILMTLSLAGLLTFYHFRTQSLQQRLQAVKKGFHRDVSLGPLPETFYKRPYPGKVWLINYADGGDAYHLNASFQVHSALNRGMDAHVMYTRRDLDADFVERNKDILSARTGVGYWLWKPYVILKTLRMIPENDVVLYMDVGASVSKNMAKYLRLLKTHDAVFFENWHANAPYMKRDCYERMGFTADVLEKPQLNAAVMLLKNTPQSRAFVQGWLTAMEDPAVSTDQPSAKAEDKRFVEHRRDQAVLTLCVLKEQVRYKQHPGDAMKIDVRNFRSGVLNWKMDGIFYQHRRRNEKAYSLFWRCPTP